jgi:hypothetical protein
MISITLHLLLNKIDNKNESIMSNIVIVINIFIQIYSRPDKTSLHLSALPTVGLVSTVIAISRPPAKASSCTSEIT